MAVHPNFPLRASDQADVMRIYLDLMIERERAASAPTSMIKQPVGPRNDSHHMQFPQELLDLD